MDRSNSVVLDVNKVKIGNIPHVGVDILFMTWNDIVGDDNIVYDLEVLDKPFGFFTGKIGMLQGIRGPWPLLFYYWLNALKDLFIYRY